MNRYVTLLLGAALISAPAFVRAATPDEIASLDKSPSQVLGLYVFCKKEQSTDLQAGDEKACFANAKSASGYDQAMASASAAPTPQDKPKGGAVRGAVGGAVVGTAIGAVAGDAGKGAKIGAVTGLLGGAARQREATHAQKAQAQQQQQQAKANAVAELKRAFSACMRAREYSVE